MLSHRHHFVTMGTESLQAKVALLLLPRTFAQVPKQDGQRVRVLLLILKNRTHVLCLGQSTLHKPFHTVDCAENSKRRWELVAKLLAEKTAGLILIGIPIWYFDISSEVALQRFATEKNQITELNRLPDKFNTLWISEEKETFFLFKSA